MMIFSRRLSGTMTDIWFKITLEVYTGVSDLQNDAKMTPVH